MGIAIDASSPSTVTGNPTATTASFTPPDDAVIVVGWAGNAELGVSPSIPTITDSLGAHLTYTLAGWHSRADDPVGHPDGQAAMWTAQVAAGAAMTISVTNNAASARHGALKVWVVTGAAVGTVGEGGNGFSTTTVSQSYTATADGSQGFMAVGDWDATGTETAGSGCTMDSSGTIAGPQISYGFLRRTIADGANGGLTTLVANLPGSSISLNWAYVELTPLVGDPAEKDPPPFIWWCPPGPNAPNGAILPWSGTADAAPTDTGIRIHENSPGVALNTAGTATATTTASFTPPAGSLLLVLWSGNSTAGANPSAPTVTDSLGVPLTYTQTDWASRADSPNADGQAAAWTAPVSASAPMTVTVNNNATSPNRHAALQVLVLVNQNATPVGAHGKLTSISASQIAQTYTATATLGQGFIAVCDWTANTQTAGMDCFTANPNSRGVIVGQISYGMFKRTVPDDVASQSNRLNVQLSGTSSDLSWVYVEILPAAGGSADATVSASTVAGVAAVPSATVQAGTEATPATVATIAGVGAVAVSGGVGAVTVAGVASVPAATVQAGWAVAAPTVVGVAAVGAVTVGAPATPATVAGVAGVGSVAVQAGSRPAPATVAAVAGVAAVQVQAGTVVVPATAVAVAAVGSVAVQAGSRAAPATVAAVAAVGAPALGGSANVGPATVAGAASVAAVTVQAGTSVAVATVTAVASVPSVSVQAGSRPAPATVVATAAVPAVTVRLSVAIAPSTVTGTASAPAPMLQAGSVALATTVAAAASVAAVTVQTGVAQPITVAAAAAVGAVTVVVVLPIGMDQGTTTAALLSGTAIPGPLFGAGSASGSTGDMALVSASTLG